MGSNKREGPRMKNRNHPYSCPRNYEKEALERETKEKIRNVCKFLVLQEKVVVHLFKFLNVLYYSFPHKGLVGVGTCMHMYVYISKSCVPDSFCYSNEYLIYDCMYNCLVFVLGNYIECYAFILYLAAS